MHGNVAEWTRTALPRPIPIARTTAATPWSQRAKVVRGGSWRDRPARAGSAFRTSYAPYLRIFNVGFRVVCEEPAARPRVAADR